MQYSPSFDRQRSEVYSRRQFLGAAGIGCLPLFVRGLHAAEEQREKLPAPRFLREWGEKGTGDGEFQLPGSIALGPDGLLYVPDQGNSRVQKFTREGKFIEFNSSRMTASTCAALVGRGPHPANFIYRMGSS